MTLFFRLDGGFGNRIFQYIKILEKRANGIRIIIVADNPSRCQKEVEEMFKTSLDFVKNNIFYKCLFRMSKCVFIARFFNFLGFEFLKGWFQDLSEIDWFLADKKRKVDYCNDNICIHVRRGDYYSPRFVDKYGNICTREYYINAVKRLIRLGDDIKYKPICVVTDDVDWVKANLPRSWKIITGNLYEDWEFIRKSRYIILSNSTFSLTAALLSESDQVLFPSIWNRENPSPNLFLEKWISIEV